MKMNRIIKVTKAQLREAEGDAFKYLDANDDSNPFNGQSTITAQGKLDGEENGNPITTDYVGKQLTNKSWSRGHMYGNINQKPHAVYNDELIEGVTTNDSDNDDVDDHYENVGDMGGLDTLSDGDDSNNLTVMPKGVDTKLNILIQSMINLTPKQKAMVVNAFLEQCDFSQIPNAWKKELMYKLMSNKDNPNINVIK